MMTNNVVLSKKKVILLQRFTAISSFLLTVASFFAILLGVVPFLHKGANALNVFIKALEVFNIFSKNFWYCLCCVLFFAVYLLLVIRWIKDIAELIKFRKKWFNPGFDGDETRKYTTLCVACFNSAIIRIVVLISFSYAVNSFRLDLIRAFILGLLVLSNMAINGIRLFYLKRNLLESIVSPASNGAILLAFFLFLFNICDVQIVDMTKQVANLFRMNNIIGLSTEYILGVIASQIVTPILHALVILNLIKAYDDSGCYGKYNEDFVISSKKHMIRNIIIVVILVFLTVFSEGTTSTDDIIGIMLSYLEFILLSVSVFVLSHNSKVDIKDAPFVEDDGDADFSNDSGVNAVQASESVIS